MSETKKSDTGSFPEEVQGLLAEMENIDSCTELHQKRVAILAEYISIHMHLSEETREIVRVAARLHDIGKIRMPVEILTKRGRLTLEERKIVRDHPRASYEILSKAGFDELVSEIAYEHHENLDGTGYPRGLKGSEIRFESRILCFADAAETATGRRPYQKPRSPDEYIEALRGEHHEKPDTLIVEAILTLPHIRKFLAFGNRIE